MRDRPTCELPDKIRAALRLLVQFHREVRGMTDPEEIRGRILEYAREAFDDKDARVAGTMEVDGVIEPTVTTPELFRLVCDHEGLDWRDQHQQEAAYARIERTLADVLANGY
jgi:hypothetical protein